MDIINKAEYQNVRLAFGDINSEIRLILISQFHTFGFSNILHSNSLQDIKNATIKDRLDLIICDESIDEGFCSFINDIRHQRIGHNPFLVIIATIDNLTENKVRKLTDSGIDDIVVKPLSVAKLLDRLNIITRSRKPFVVTTDYTGPDRRKDPTPRPGRQAIPLIDVPNPLVYLKDKEQNKADISEAIDKAATIINEQKMERHAFQIGYLVDQILPLYNECPKDEITSKDINHLIFVSNDLNKRLKNTRFSDAADLCVSMTDLAKRIRKTHPSPNAKDLELLPVLSQAIHLTFQTESDDSTSVHEIVENLRNQNIITSKKKHA